MKGYLLKYKINQRNKINIFLAKNRRIKNSYHFNFLVEYQNLLKSKLEYNNLILLVSIIAHLL
jgi:hypothetical protein